MLLKVSLHTYLDNPLITGTAVVLGEIPDQYTGCNYQTDYLGPDTAYPLAADTDVIVNLI